MSDTQKQTDPQPNGCDPATGSALCYADGTPVKRWDVVKINKATCTVIRIINDRDGNPWMVACRIEGCGTIEHGVFAESFRKHHPQNDQGQRTASH